MHDEGSSVGEGWYAGHLQGRIREYGQCADSICCISNTLKSSFLCSSWAYWLNYSYYNGAVNGTLTVIYVPSSITPEVGEGWKEWENIDAKMQKTTVWSR